LPLEINIHHHFPSDMIPAWAKKLQVSVDQVNGKLDTVMTTQAQVMEKVVALTANVAADDDMISGFETFLANLAKQMADLKAQIANADVPQGIADGIDAIGQAVTTHRDRIVADIKANTPAV
jgi:hypothetical protein